MISPRKAPPATPDRVIEPLRVAADPTSLAEVGSRHVLLARGRDYADVRPLSGIYSGPAAEHLGVTVEVTRLS